MKKDSNPTVQASKATKIAVQGAPKVGKVEAKELAAKVAKRRRMQPIAVTPTKRQHVSRNPLDLSLPPLQNKVKEVVLLREATGNKILRIKEEAKEDKQMTSHKSKARKLLRKEALCIVKSSSTDTKNSLSVKDTIEKNSRAEVQGDSDYMPSRD